MRKTIRTRSKQPCLQAVAAAMKSGQYTTCTQHTYLTTYVVEVPTRTANCEILSALLSISHSFGVGLASRAGGGRSTPPVLRVLPQQHSWLKSVWHYGRSGGQISMICSDRVSLFIILYFDSNILTVLYTQFETFLKKSS